MKRKLLLFTVILLTFAMCFTACDGGAKTVRALTVVDGTLVTEYEIGATPDFSGVKAVVSYSDGSAETVTADKLNIGNVDTSTAGVKKLSVSYNGFTIEVDITVKEAQGGGNEGGGNEGGGNEGGGETATLTGIEIVESSVLKSVVKGETYNTSGIQIKALYDDESFKILGAADVTISQIDTANVGETTLTVSYGGFTDSVKINVIGVESLLVDANSIANIVNVGETLNTAGLKVVATYTDKTTAIIGIDKLTVSSLDMTKLGKQKIKITYIDCEAEYEVYVNDVVSIALDKTSVVSSVMVGETLDTSGVKISAKYHNDTVKIYDLASGKFTVEFAGSSVAGKKDLTVKYGTLTDKMEINVIGVKEMAVDSNVVKEIKLGESFLLDKLPVNVTYTDNKTAQLNLAFTGTVNTAAVGDNTLSIKYLDKTITYTVKVYGVESMVIDSSVPTEVVYGGSFTDTELKTVVTYTNGKTETLTLAYVGEVKTDVIGDNELTVTYLNKTITYTVNVYGVESMVVDSSVASEIKLGDSFDADTIATIVTYTNGKTETLNLEYTGEVDGSEVGDNELALTYLNKTVTHNVKVYGVKEMTVDSSVITEIKRGEDFTLETIKVNVVYGNKANTAETLDLAFTGTVDTDVVGENTLTVSLLDKTITHIVKVYGVVGIELVIDNEDTVVTEGVVPSIDGLEVYFVYGDKAATKVLVDEYTTNFDSLVAEGAFNDSEDDTLTVTYVDEYGDTHTNDLRFSTTPPVVTEIVVNSYLDKILKGKEYNKTLVTEVVAYYNNNTHKAVSGFEISVIDTDEIGEKTLTVTYDGKTAEVKVMVRELTLLEIEGLASEIFYGETFDTSNIKVKATYSDNESEYITTGYELTGSIDGNVVDEQSLTVAYEGKEATHTVEVIGVKTMTVITSDTVKDKLLLKETFNKENISVAVEYTNGSKTTIPYSSLTVSGDEVNVDLDGTYNVKIKYLDKEITYSVRVYGIKSITVSNTVSKINKGEAYNGQLTVTVVYNDDYKTVTLNAGEYDLDGSVNKDVADDYTLTVTYKGATASCIVTVREVKSLEVTSSVSLIEKGETYNGQLTVIAVYSNGDRETLKAGEYEVIETVNGNVAGDQYVKVKYKGVEGTSDKIHVRGIVSIEILNAPTFVNCFSTFDTSNVIIHVVYTNGEADIPLTADGVTVTQTVDPNALTNYYAPEEKTFAVSYKGVPGSVTVDLRPIKLVMIVFGTFPSELFVGDSFDTSKTVISVVYNDGDPDPTNDYGVLVYAPNFETVAPDTSTAGDKAYKVTYIYMSQTYPVHVKGVKEMILSEGSIPTTVNKEGELDLSGIKFLVQYTNGMWITVEFDDIQVITNVDTATVGTKKLVVKYREKTVEIDIEVEEYNTELSSDTIFGVSLPDNLVARDTYKLNFKDQDNAYVVGDDNKYYFYLELLMLDDDNNIVDVDGKGREYDIEVSLVDGATETLLTGDELAKYVAIDKTENSYDFVDDVATGKTFKLRIAPKGACVLSEEERWREHTVTVVDAYNIYDAKELNLITNHDCDLTHLLDTENSISQLEVVNNFLDAFFEEKQMTRPTSINGIVIHDNVDIKPTDLPPEYYFPYTNKNGEEKTEFYDQISLYRYGFGAWDTSFSMYGNYYGIYSYNLPCVVAKEANAGNTDGLSGTALFYFGSKPDLHYIDEGTYNEERINANVIDMSFRDNDPNSNDQSASERHMRGLVCLKPSMTTLNILNSNIHAFFVSTCPETDATTMNIIDSDLYNSWQGHIFIWSNNWVNREIHKDGYPDRYPHENYRNVKINITNSRLAKCGGPVILAQTEGTSNAYIRCGTDVTVDDKSELYSYVTGQEAWFVAINQTALAGQILAMNQLIQMGIPEGVTASYTNDYNISGVTTMNMIMVNMGAGMPTGGYADYEGSLTIGGNIVLNQNDADKTKHDDGTNPYLSGIIQSALQNPEKGIPPIFQSSEVPQGYPQNVKPGTVWSDGATGVFPAMGDAVDENFYKGDYITLYFMGMGIALEYYH